MHFVGTKVLLLLTTLLRSCCNTVSRVVICTLIGALGSESDFASPVQANLGWWFTDPKPSNGPAMKEFQNNLSHLICVFLHPILETNSMVCWGVKASMASATWKLERMMGWHSLIELEVEKKVKD